MHILVVYESMFGNTHVVAEAIAASLRPSGDLRLVPTRDATTELVEWADLVVAGGPTHAHGMTSEGSRRSARERASQPGSDLKLDPDATGPGMREWLEALPTMKHRRAAAFDTRVKGPALLTGRASATIARKLRAAGFGLAADPESFLVDTHNRLVDGELTRAASWGATLAGDLVGAR